MYSLNPAKLRNLRWTLPICCLRTTEIGLQTTNPYLRIGLTIAQKRACNDYHVTVRHDNQSSVGTVRYTRFVRTWKKGIIFRKLSRFRFTTQTMCSNHLVLENILIGFK